MAFVVPRNGREFLESIGLGEYATAFDDHGFRDVQDILRMSEDDLKLVGMTKLGHRKAFLRDAQLRLTSTGACNIPHLEEGLEVVAPGSLAIGDSSPKELAPIPHHGGAKIVVEIVAGMLVASVAQRWKDLKPYIKLMICKRSAKGAECIEGTLRKTSSQSGHNPVWWETFEFPTNLFHEGNFIIFEMKHERSVAANVRLGILVLPATYFQTFSTSNLVDKWFPLKKGNGKEATNQGDVRVRLYVSEGVPLQKRRAYLINAVKMQTWKLRIAVLEARVQDRPKSTYVKISFPNTNVCGSTKVVKDVKFPVWNEEFEFFVETTKAKYIIVKLKERKGVLSRALGLVKIPILFFLSQKGAAELDQWYTTIDENGVKKGEVHLRMHVVQRTAEEASKINRGRYTSLPYIPRAQLTTPPSEGAVDTAERGEHEADSDPLPHSWHEEGPDTGCTESHSEEEDDLPPPPSPTNPPPQIVRRTRRDFWTEQLSSSCGLRMTHEGQPVHNCSPGSHRSTSFSVGRADEMGHCGLVRGLEVYSPVLSRFVPLETDENDDGPPESSAAWEGSAEAIG